MKKFFSLLLAGTLLFSSAQIFALAQENTSARLFNVYGNGMLFEQNSPAIFAGYAPKGAKITCTLLNKQGESLLSGSSVADENGEFKVSFTSPEGGFVEYDVVLYANEKEFARLEDIVFGELWLASGQSNMDMPMGYVTGGIEMREKGLTGSKWIRFLQMPATPEYNGSADYVPALPQKEVQGCKWIKASDKAVYGTSGVAYFFANALSSEINMPVGVMQASLGGTLIATWLSREAIEDSPEVMQLYEKNKSYVPLKDWNEKKLDQYRVMTGNFNQKTASLGNFRPSGMIWYQGESEIMLGAEYGDYTKQFELLQESYTKHFGLSSPLPIVFTQLASYLYSADSDVLQRMNVEFAEIANKHPDSMAVTSIYDVSLDYDPSLMSIHPLTKAPVGEKMAYAAAGLVYGKHTSYSAPYPVKTEIKDGCIYVTLNHTGRHLTTYSSDTPKGFAICGSDGIYVPANAEIVSPDTIKIFSSKVAEPKSATYAYSQTNNRANLFADNITMKMAVSPFVTDMSYNKHFFVDNGWYDCDSPEMWHVHNNEYSAYYKTWTASGATIIHTSDVAHSGDMSVCIRDTSDKFSISPQLYYKNDKSTELFKDLDRNYSDYGKISFYAKNNSYKDVELDEIRFYINKATWFTPAEVNSREPNAVLPADGQWHYYEFDLDSLYLNGNECGAIYSRDRLEKITDIKFMFSGTKSGFFIDDFEFAPSSEKTKFVRFEKCFDRADTIGEKISAVFSTLFSLISDMFA